MMSPMSPMPPVPLVSNIHNPSYVNTHHDIKKFGEILRRGALISASGIGEHQWIDGGLGLIHRHNGPQRMINKTLGGYALVTYPCLELDTTLLFVAKLYNTTAYRILDPTSPSINIVSRFNSSTLTRLFDSFLKDRQLVPWEGYEESALEIEFEMAGIKSSNRKLELAVSNPELNFSIWWQSEQTNVIAISEREKP